MSEEQATSTKKNESSDPTEAYKILLQRQINEDRIIIERTTIFLIASSFLFAGFVMLLNQNLAPYKLLRIVLPVVGIILTCFVYLLNLSATKALRFWHHGQGKIEETEGGLFAYMRGNEITPHYDLCKYSHGEIEWKQNDECKWTLQSLKGRWRLLNKPLQWAKLRPIYQLYLPVTFWVLWTVSLVLAVINFLN